MIYFIVLSFIEGKCDDGDTSLPFYETHHPFQAGGGGMVDEVGVFRRDLFLSQWTVPTALSVWRRESMPRCVAVVNWAW